MGTPKKVPISEEKVLGMIENALEKFAADETGLIDYALSSGGGVVLDAQNEYLEQRDFFGWGAKRF
eukprot:TRINITY_DN13805_c0_g1_i1.p2 TRINITY_DN13805_c0_g1~~TRINITY_DN13805_c0_g1_i1.p2  ORF type:complete len:66 (+),score=18.51 TRINITY_DN13805_c0_g1_i1:312-509(+)